MKNETEDLPLISVIIPVYNGEKYINQLYTYVNNQDYTNLEIIFINNNSIDGTVDIINRLNELDDRIILCNEYKQGAGAARNRGVTISQGDYVTFFDIDDTYSNNKISMLYNVFKKHNSAEMVFGQIIAKYQNGKEYYPNYDTITSGLNIPPNLATNFLNFGVGAGPTTILCRKDAFNSIGGFEEDMMIGEDVAFSFKMAVYHKVYFLPKVVTEYIKHPESTLASYKRKNPQLNFYYDQFKHFYLPYIYDNNLFLVSTQLKIIYQYCVKGLISQSRIYNYSFFARIKYLYKELKYLNKFGLSFCYFPFILIASYSNQYLYRIMMKIFHIIKSYNY